MRRSPRASPPSSRQLAATPGCDNEQEQPTALRHHHAGCLRTGRLDAPAGGPCVGRRRRLRPRGSARGGRRSGRSAPRRRAPPPGPSRRRPGRRLAGGLHRAGRRRLHDGPGDGYSHPDLERDAARPACRVRRQRGCCRRRRRHAAVADGRGGRRAADGGGRSRHRPGGEPADGVLDGAARGAAARGGGRAVPAGSQGPDRGRRPARRRRGTAQPYGVRRRGRIAARRFLVHRFGIFHAGQQSARDPRYTVVPQQERITAGQGGGSSRHS